MRNCSFPDQKTVGGQITGDFLIGIIDEHSRIRPCLVGKDTLIVNRRKNRQVVMQAAHIVFTAMSRGGMDDTGTSVEGDIVRQNDQGFPLHEGVSAFAAFNITGRKGGEKFIAPVGHFPVEIGEGLLDQIFGHYPDFIPDRNGTVPVVGVKGDGKVGRQGPGGRCPDQRVYLAAGQLLGG